MNTKNSIEHINLNSLCDIGALYELLCVYVPCDLETVIAETDAYDRELRAKQAEESKAWEAAFNASQKRESAEIRANQPGLYGYWNG